MHPGPSNFFLSISSLHCCFGFLPALFPSIGVHSTSYLPCPLSDVHSGKMSQPPTFCCAYHAFILFLLMILLIHYRFYLCLLYWALIFPCSSVQQPTFLFDVFWETMSAPYVIVGTMTVHDLLFQAHWHLLVFHECAVLPKTSGSGKKPFWGPKPKRGLIFILVSLPTRKVNMYFFNVTST